MISESYRNKLMSLAGISEQILAESSRVDFLKKDFEDRVGRKYDKFLKFHSLGNWSKDKENDNFIKNVVSKMTIKNGKLAHRDVWTKIMMKQFEKLEQADPTENKQYLNWLINIYLSGNLLDEDIYKANEELSLFAKNKEKIPLEQRNINSFPDLPSLSKVVAKYSTEAEMSASEKERVTKLEGAEQVYDSPNWKIIIPKTKEAACLYGKGTKWCTTSMERGMFDYYNKKGPLYILINKKISDDRSVLKKLQFHFETNQFMDTLDNRIDVTKFFKEIIELKNFFKKIGEIDAGFEIEHMLVSKKEGLVLLKTSKNKIDLIDRKGFEFFKKFFIEIGASKEFINAILNDKEFIKILFEKDLFTDLIDSYDEMKVQLQGLDVIKLLPWLDSWILENGAKPEIIQKLIFSICEHLGSDGKEFSKHLLKRGDIIWNSIGRVQNP